MTEIVSCGEKYSLIKKINSTADGCEGRGLRK
jgi:hypothetical protein